MPEVVFPMDNTKSFTEQQIVGHNRWHPDIPAVATVRPGADFREHATAGRVRRRTSCPSPRTAPDWDWHHDLLGAHRPPITSNQIPGHAVSHVVARVPRGGWSGR